MFEGLVALVVDGVDQVDNDIVFLDTNAVEVFSNSSSQLLLCLAVLLSPACHGRRVDSDAARSRENYVMVRGGEGQRGVEAVFAAVLVECFAFNRLPLDLEKVRRGLRVSAYPRMEGRVK